MSNAARRDPYRLVSTTLGNYLVQDIVGVGGMGVVYRARHLNVKKQVALKILKPDLALASPELIKLFFEEAEKAGRLNHPNIIRVTDADMADEIAFLVMDWLEGRTLEAELVEKGTFDLARVAALLEQICEAVDYAHRQQIVHRDLKPSNIMICSDHLGKETVKILDFGIAKALDTTIGLNSRVLGAPYYASPEQLTLSAPVDQRSDVYSLGVTVYQMLSGALPFNAESIEKVIQQHLTVSPPELRQVRPELSEEVEEVVLRALSKRPAERYQSTPEFARAFRQAANVAPGALVLTCTGAGDRPLPGASFYLDGKYAGQADAQGQWRHEELSPRLYRVEAMCPGYLDAQQDFMVETRRESSLVLRLTEKSLGELMIKTGVPGAQVFLNGAAAGTTDETGALHLHDLEPGEAEVGVRHRKYLPAAQKIRVVKGQTAHVELTLSRAQHFGKLFGSAAKEKQDHRQALPRPTIGVLVAGVCVLLALAAIFLSRNIILSKVWTDPARANTLLEVPPSPTPGGVTDEALARQKARGEAAALALMGKELSEQKPPDHLGAESAYSQAVALDPDNAAYHFWLGAARLGLEKFELAETAFREAVARDGTNHRYHLNLGLVLTKLEKPAASDEALDEYRTAIRLAEEQGVEPAILSEYYKHLASALINLKRMTEGNAANDVANALISGESPTPTPTPAVVAESNSNQLQPTPTPTPRVRATPRPTPISTPTPRPTPRPGKNANGAILFDSYNPDRPRNRDRPREDWKKWRRGRVDPE